MTAVLITASWTPPATAQLSDNPPGQSTAATLSQAVPTQDCPADLNNDNILDSGDIAAFVQYFIAGDLEADINNDNFLDSGDIGAFVDAFLAGCDFSPNQSEWYRGNTHTHTLWSDGDAAPEFAIDWYLSNEYDFLVISDHNIVLDHEKWFPVAEEGTRLNTQHVDDLRARFGDQWVELRTNPNGVQEMKLKRLSELRARFQSPSFLLIAGEEITDSFQGKQLHINAINTESYIAPQHGSSMLDTMQRNLDAIKAHADLTGHPTLGHINHPNYQWAITPDDLASIRGEQFFEVYNGHQDVNNIGDEDHPSVEAMWDHALTIRMTTTGENLMAIAADDAHSYHVPNAGSSPGRGWIMVCATSLEPDEIIHAMNRGDFYATNGVEIESFGDLEGTYHVEFKANPGVSYHTEFIGTRRNLDGSLGPTGEIFRSTTSNPATYEFDGSELYVRARVVSSVLHPSPFEEGVLETAWLQPIVPSSN